MQHPPEIKQPQAGGLGHVRNLSKQHKNNPGECAIADALSGVSFH